jgi:signal peptidase I
VTTLLLHEHTMHRGNGVNISQPAQPRGRSALRSWGILIAVIVLVSALYFLNPLGTADDSIPGRLLGLRFFMHPSESMEPNLHLRQRFIASAWPYAFGRPQAGDIIVFRSPHDPAALYAKRIIATPGSTVAIVNGITFVNGAPLAETYLRNMPTSDPRFPNSGPWQVRAEDYFVMGDNRLNSEDSRIWGPIGGGTIIGKVIGVSDAE